MDSDYERILLTKNELFVYKIPPLTTSRGHKATDWDLDKPMWTGRMQIVAKGSSCYLKLIDRDTGNLFARAPVDSYPGPGMEPVTDSSRYFVIKIVNEADPKRSAFIGIGFADRGDSFDLNVALQDHFKSMKQEEEIALAGGTEAFMDSQPKLDLGFKEGQTIKVNINIPKKATGRPKGKPAVGGAAILLPPPPGSTKVSNPAATQVSNATPSAPQSDSILSERKSSGDQESSLLDLEFDKLSVAKQPSSNASNGSELDTQPVASLFPAPSSGDSSSNWAEF